ncbi:MAG: Zn-ribbon domain-containing OB-fold protein [Hyphomicrobiales bacterium]|nr:Zn-ribbon domain-containing OB-fold protein [Hyphomicrobiales bacterium]
MADRKIQAPEINPDSAAFWQAAREGRFLLRRCNACGEAHWYPRARCPYCLGEAEWTEVSGRGTIYTFSVMRRAPVPYAIAYVMLEEGPAMLTNIVDCDLDALAIGQRVRVVFKPSEGGGPPVPMFCPE